MMSSKKPKIMVAYDVEYADVASAQRQAEQFTKAFGPQIEAHHPVRFKVVFVERSGEE